MDRETTLDKHAVLEEFRAAGALLEGHFVLSSGRHSPAYMQCARVLMDATRAGRLGSALADKIRARIDEPFDLVVSPAMGGVVVGYGMGRQLGVPAIFMERVDGNFALRRGFDIAPGARCLMVEDVVTTGLSSRECIAAIAAAGGNCVAAACLADRSNGTADVGVSLVALVALDVPSYADGEVPAALLDIPVTKPGSRFLKS